MTDFPTRIVTWQRQQGRHDLPWQYHHLPVAQRDPYRIWLSEIMLQQTQVTTVIGYFNRFIARFPDVLSLAQATQDEVMPYWAGLGYYARARNLHRAAQHIATTWRDSAQNIQWRTDPASWYGLLGVGQSTAHAILALAFDIPLPILDGNVKRVLARYTAYGAADGASIHHSAGTAALWAIATTLLHDNPQMHTDIAAYTQGMMDLGATICTPKQPRCHACPVQSQCQAFALQRQLELPAPKPAKRQPIKHWVIQLYCRRTSNANLSTQGDWQIWLQQRLQDGQATGIWGGLWCGVGLGEMQALPLFDPHDQHWCDHELPSLTHVFTHFKLHLRVGLCWGSPPHESLSDGKWYDLAELHTTSSSRVIAVAMPQPMQRIIAATSDYLANQHLIQQNLMQQDQP
jgi:A/G-specific adenine glycosylase